MWIGELKWIEMQWKWKFTSLLHPLISSRRRSILYAQMRTVRKWKDCMHRSILNSINKGKNNCHLTRKYMHQRIAEIQRNHQEPRVLEGGLSRACKNKYRFTRTERIKTSQNAQIIEIIISKTDCLPFLQLVLVGSCCPGPSQNQCPACASLHHQGS